MTAEVKHLDKSEVELIIEVSPEEAQPHLIRVAEKLAKEIKVEGFRPGKAPYNIIKQKLGEEAILQEALDDIISQTYFEALKENKIVSVGQPKIDIQKMAPNNPLVYKATVAVLPKVKIGDYKTIKLKREQINIKDEQVDKVIEDVRKMRAKESTVDRPAQTGDKVNIDFDVYQDKVPIEHGAQKNYSLVIGENKFIPGFEDKIIGMKAGAEKAFELKFPDKYFQEKLAGKTAEFKVKCHQVMAVELPELTDEFIKDLSGNKFDSVVKLKENIKTNLEQEEKNKQEQRLEIEMLDKLVELSEFEVIPDMLIENESHKMLHELQDGIDQQGMKFEDYLVSIKKTEQQLEEEFKPQAEKRVKTAIITREIFNQEEFEVRPDEVEAEIELILKNYPNNQEFRKQLESETYKDYLKNVLGNRKVIEFLKKEIIS